MDIPERLDLKNFVDETGRGCTQMDFPFFTAERAERVAFLSENLTLTSLTARAGSDVLHGRILADQTRGEDREYDRVSDYIPTSDGSRIAINEHVIEFALILQADFDLARPGVEPGPLASAARMRRIQGRYAAHRLRLAVDQGRRRLHQTLRGLAPTASIDVDSRRRAPFAEADEQSGLNSQEVLGTRTL